MAHSSHILSPIPPSKKINKNILGPNFFDPKLTRPSVPGDLRVFGAFESLFPNSPTQEICHPTFCFLCPLNDISCTQYGSFLSHFITNLFPNSPASQEFLLRIYFALPMHPNFLNILFFSSSTRKTSQEC